MQGIAGCGCQPRLRNADRSSAGEIANERGFSTVAALLE